MPKDLEAVYAFLASRSLPYIGARTADKIIDKFGAAALEVIANDPAQLTLIPGISADKADRIQQEFKRMFGMRELIAYLAQFEISPRRAMEVFRTFGPGAMQAIQQNPYLLCGEPLAAGLPPRRQHRPVLPDGRGLRPAAGSRPPAHPAPQRRQRPHLSAPGAAAGNGVELHPPAPRKAGGGAGQLHPDRETGGADVRRHTVYLSAGSAGRRAGHRRPSGHADQARKADGPTASTRTSRYWNWRRALLTRRSKRKPSARP